MQIGEKFRIFFFGTFAFIVTVMVLHRCIYSAFSMLCITPGFREGLLQQNGHCPYGLWESMAICGHELSLA